MQAGAGLGRAPPSARRAGALLGVRAARLPRRLGGRRLPSTGSAGGPSTSRVSVAGANPARPLCGRSEEMAVKTLRLRGPRVSGGRRAPGAGADARGTADVAGMAGPRPASLAPQGPRPAALLQAEKMAAAAGRGKGGPRDSGLGAEGAGLLGRVHSEGPGRVLLLRACPRGRIVAGTD